MQAAETSEPVRVRGRYAPSPTGPMHVGNARTALVAWLAVRRAGGTFVWREEDLDGPRVVPGMAAAQRDDLAWLGLDWDEGPDVGGPRGPYRQSACGPLYEAALAQLARADRLFPCRQSRRDLAALASAPHGGEEAPYPAALRPARLDPDWYAPFEAGGAGAAGAADAAGVVGRVGRVGTVGGAGGERRGGDAALRFRVAPGVVCFRDRVQGERCEEVARAVGDFVLKRRDGIYAYQLAVVVDDLRMGIGEVVRGADLLDSTPRQIQLAAALGGAAPVYAHVPLALGPGGEKLSKRDAALSLAGLRAAGATPEQVTGFLAWSLGLLAAPRACRPAALVDGFAWERLGRAAWIASGDLPRQVLAVA